MKREEALAHCMAKPGAWLDEPWEGDQVVKVGSKVFAFLGGPDATDVGVKCGAGREEADEWLRRHPGDATASSYIGRYGWNTLALHAGIPDDELLEALDASYDAIVRKLPLRERPAARLAG